MGTSATRAVALVVALTLSTAACGGDDSSDAPSVPPASSAAPATDTRLQLVVDTDLAADDLVALSYLAADSRVRLLAVTVTGTGEVRCPRGAEIARGLLASMDLPDVPSACGRARPLSGDRAFPDAWRAAADDAWGLVLPDVATPADALDAVELLTRVLTSAAEPVTLLTLGPLTNVAEAIAARPELVDRLSRIVVMGGALQVPGNVQPEGAREPLAMEWNLYVDPEAAGGVVAAGVPLTLVTLDATNAVPVTRNVLARLAANDVTDASRRVGELFARFPPPFLWDPLAAIAVTDPELVPRVAATVTVLTDGDEAGRTVVAPDGSPIDVAGPPDAEVVLDRLLRTLAGTGADEPLAVATTAPVLGEVTVGFDGTACSYDGPNPIDAGAYRLTLVASDVPYAVVVGQLLGGATLDETIAWIAEHPEQQPPMVGATVFIGVDMPDPPDSVLFEPGSVAIVCVTDQESLVPGIEVAVVG